MENNIPVPMYVADPREVKDNLGTHITYKLEGTRVPEPLDRRYRDFDAFRKKLQERWPGIYIPNIPHKKTVGNKDKEVVEMRIEMINRFCIKLSKIGYLFNSEEMELFLQNSSDVPKTLSNLKQQSYEDLLKKYSMVFTDYDDNFDTTAGRKDQDEFWKRLNEMYPKLKTFKDLIQNIRAKQNSIRENYKIIINMLSIYEKETVNNYVNGDDSKLIFYDLKNGELLKQIELVENKIINPYDRLFDAVSEDYLDTEAMKEGFESLKNLQDTYDKLTKTLTSTNTQLIDLQSGKTNVKTMFSFKSKEEDISGLMLKKERLEKDINCLGQIIKVATFNMQNEIKNFKAISLDNYYAELTKLEEDTEKNSKIYDALWDEVIKNKNIAEFH